MRPLRFGPAPRRNLSVSYARGINTHLPSAQEAPDLTHLYEPVCVLSKQGLRKN